MPFNLEVSGFEILFSQYSYLFPMVLVVFKSQEDMLTNIVFE